MSMDEEDVDGEELLDPEQDEETLYDDLGYPLPPTPKEGIEKDDFEEEDLGL